MKLKVTIGHDTDIENPADDHTWTPYSFSHKHANFKDPIQAGWFDGSMNCTNPGLRQKLDVGLAFRLGYYEHGQSSWFIQGTGLPGSDCAFDGVQFACVLIWELKPSDMGAKCYEDRANDAKRFLETYTAWCNGQGYYYVVDELEECDLGHTHEVDLVDSCGGFYGNDLDYMFEQIQAATEGHEVVEIAGAAKDLADYHDVQKKGQPAL